MSTNLYFKYLKDKISQVQNLTADMENIRSEYGDYLGCKNLYDRPLNFEQLEADRLFESRRLQESSFLAYEPITKNRPLRQHIIMLKRKLLVWQILLHARNRYYNGS